MRAGPCDARALLVHSESALRVLSEASETQRRLASMNISADQTEKEWRRNVIFCAYRSARSVHDQCTLRARYSARPVHAYVYLDETMNQRFVKQNV